MYKLKPNQEVSLFLAILAIGRIASNPSTDIFIHLAASLGLSILLYYLFKVISKKPKLLSNTITTGLIIFLVHNHNFGTGNLGITYATILATFAAISLKFFFQVKASTIINPAVFGLLLSYLILPTTFLSWWGTNYNFALGEQKIPLALILLALWIIFGLKRWRKFPSLLSFLIVSAIGIYLGKGLDTFSFTFTDGTIYFLGAIMLIDPKTSPILKKDQLIFGTVAGLSLVLLKIFSESLPSELLAITIANISFFISKLSKIAKQKRAK